MDFKKLELTGFKSFVEKTNFLIENGLTGIVGPNGCGKSNIVEALRWCMGETSAKSMRGSGMEDVIFSGTANRPSKNIAEVMVTLDNKDNSGSVQFKNIDTINVKRRIEKDKGSKYYINEKEVRAKDAQMFFADLSTGAHSPSIISQGRIGALVTAKPSDRRAILEEAAGISGIHARRHESELRLNAAENNLKRADELKRQKEKQLDNLKKQAEEAGKYKKISDEIKRVEAGLYFLKLRELEQQMKISNDTVGESDDEVSGLTIELNHKNDLINEENKKLNPLRDKKLEVLSKLQRINLDLENLEKQEEIAKEDKIKIIKSQNTIIKDLEREKNIIIDATSNEKRLNEEKKTLLEISEKYIDHEKESEQNLILAEKELKQEQKNLKEFSQNLAFKATNKEILNFIGEIETSLNQIKENIHNNENEKAKQEINNVLILIEKNIQVFETEQNKNSIDKINEITNKISIYQENYANALSKNQSIKNDLIKREERINNIDIENDKWKSLKSNSEKMSFELEKRNEEIKNELEDLNKLPQDIAIKKGQSMQNISTTEKEKDDLLKELEGAEKEYENLNVNLKSTQEKMIIAREKRARSKATYEGLQNRKTDLLNTIKNDLNIGEDKLLEYSDLNEVKELPDALEQEEKLDRKKRIRESLGSVNLRADEESGQFEKEILQMQDDRDDLVTAIVKLRSSITELNQKGRERLLSAFEKVNRKFNEVYTKLFNGGNATLELVDSDDPLEAGLEMLVSPPGKRLQSITLLSGGEQALTALSLIFAVFLTSPAPICVLDEVDAPLDDANVTRFCNLLNELIKITPTKFIIITHHALTMSKMNRLYGVTMAEKGISQLVAVDLERAEELVA